MSSSLKSRIFITTGLFGGRHINLATTYLLRLLLSSALERRARNASWDNPIVPEEFTEDLGIHSSPMAYWASVLRYPTRLISGAPESWADLEAFLSDRIVEVPVADCPPGPLEFAGVAVRDIDRRRLAWASPIFRRMIGQYYSPRRIADLYAQAGQWEEAFPRYSKISPMDRVRPFDFDDRLDAGHAVDALCSTLHAEVDRGPDHLRSRLIEGANLVLGLPQASVWHLENTWASAKGATNPPEAKDIAALLPVAEQLSEGWWPLPEPYNSYAVAAILPMLRPGRYLAIVIGDFAERTVISRERERLVRKLFKHFLAAHKRGGAMETVRRRVEVRDHQRELLSSISDSLSKNVLDVKQVLRMAAEGLRKMDYYRVEFCFVDPRRTRIKGVVDVSGDPNGVDVAAMTDFPLKPATADIQPYVVQIKESKIVPDPNAEPLINPQVLVAAKLRPLAIVPIVNRNQIVLGTIHVERNDSAVPTREEVKDLLFFGRQLASIIEQSERVRLLHDALDKIPSPVSLVDFDGDPVYANRPAADLFAVEASWRDIYSKPISPAIWGEKVRTDIRQCLQGTRTVHHYTGIGTKANYRGTVLCDRIVNWQGEPTAAVVHVEDLNYLERVIDVFGSVARSNDTGSACRNLLNACLTLGVRWARLYLVDPSDPNAIVSQLWVGEGEEPFRSDFRGNARFERGFHPDFVWRAMDASTPQTFYFMPEGKDGEFFRTPAGLEAFIVTNPPHTQYAPKTPHTFWIDLPLCTPYGVLGKVTLDCDPRFLPEDFEMLKVLSANAAFLLGAFQEKERLTHQHDEYIERSAAERVMASIAHNLNTRVAALPGLLTLYKASEADPSQLPHLNQRFKFVLEHVLTTVGRSKVLLAAIRLDVKRFDVCDCLESTLHSAHPDSLWTLTCHERPLEVEWDSHKVGSAILELIRNSQQVADSPVLEMRVEPFERADAPWIRIIYCDNGPGIPIEFKNEIFKHFFSRKQVDQTGTGLGLWFVFRVVEAHGGVVTEIGLPGAGAKFVIESPRYAVQQEMR
jgi:GAF domain-containing protein